MERTKDIFLEERERQSNVTVQEVHDYINTLKQGVLDGERDSLLALNELKEIEDNVKASKTEVMPTVLTEAESYGGKKFQHKGFYVERRSGRAIWNYKDVPEWQQIDSSKKELEKTLKARHQIWSKGQEVLDPETGESLPVPSVSFAPDSIIIRKA